MATSSFSTLWWKSVTVGRKVQNNTICFTFVFSCSQNQVDYQIVGTFTTENETKQAIKEALTKFKEWNPSTSPKFCMTDYCNEEIEVLEETFVGM